MKLARPKEMSQAVRYLIVPADQKTEEVISRDAAASNFEEPPPAKRFGQLYLTVPGSLERRVDGWEVGEAFFKAFRHKIPSMKLSLRVYGLEEDQRHAVHWKTMWVLGKSCPYREPDA